MHYVSHKLAVNVNVSKMAFAQKIQVRLNREGSIYSNSWQHSQLLRDYVSDLHHPEMELKAPIKDSEIPCSIKTVTARSQNQYISEEHLLFQKAASE